MSITLRNFLRTQTHKPQLLKRYIDDITMIWTNTEEDLLQFLTALNTFHPSLHFTYTYSYNSIDFLDLTTYKGPNLSSTHTLDTKTYQKEQNLYQYLHYTSNHTHTKQLLQENVQDMYELTLQKTTTTTWLNCLNIDY